MAYTVMAYIVMARCASDTYQGIDIDTVQSLFGFQVCKVTEYHDGAHSRALGGLARMRRLLLAFWHNKRAGTKKANMYGGGGGGGGGGARSS